MSFTYDLATSTGKVRFEIGDTTEGRGIRPNAANFTDEEIEYLVSIEGSNGRAAARAAETLARAWASEPTDWKLGPESEKQNAAEYWQAEAKRLRGLYGYADGTTAADGLFDWYDPTE